MVLDAYLPEHQIYGSIALVDTLQTAEQVRLVIILNADEALRGFFIFSFVTAQLLSA